MKMLSSLFVLLLSIVISHTGCSHRAPTILFIVPNGFKGLLLISEDPNAETLRVVKDAYTVEIPKDGRVVIKSLAPFNKWHKEIAKYPDGQNLPDKTSMSNTENGFYGLPYVQGRGIHYFVGTRSDYDALLKRYDFDKFPLATKIDAAALNKRPGLAQ